MTQDLVSDDVHISDDHMPTMFLYEDLCLMLISTLALMVFVLCILITSFLANCRILCRKSKYHSCHLTHLPDCVGNIKNTRSTRTTNTISLTRQMSQNYMLAFVRS